MRCRHYKSSRVHWKTYSGNQPQVLFCIVLKYSQLCFDLVWHTSETPFSISSLTHTGVVCERRIVLLSRKQSSLTFENTPHWPRASSNGRWKGDFCGPWKSLWNLQCPIRLSQAPSLRTLRYLSSCHLSQCEECNQMQMPPTCVRFLHTHSL